MSAYYKVGHALLEGSTAKCNNFNVSSIEVVALGRGAFRLLVDSRYTASTSI